MQLLLGEVDPKNDDALISEYHSYLVARPRGTSAASLDVSVEAGPPPASASYTLERLRQEMLLTMASMLVQLISDSAHPGKAAVSFQLNES